MCNRAKYKGLDERIGKCENRLAKVEATVDAMRGEVKEDFALIRAQLNDIYHEKIAWGEWARTALTAVGKWLGKWGAVIILTAIGVGNAPKVVECVAEILRR